MRIAPQKQPKRPSVTAEERWRRSGSDLETIGGSPIQDRLQHGPVLAHEGPVGLGGQGGRVQRQNALQVRPGGGRLLNQQNRGRRAGRHDLRHHEAVAIRLERRLEQSRTLGSARMRHSAQHS